MGSVATNDRDSGYTEPRRIIAAPDPFPNMVRDYHAAVRSFYRNLPRPTPPESGGVDADTG